jgi:hypothetical protein
MAKQKIRFLGLELGGSRRTALVCLEYHPRERRVYHYETAAHVVGSREETADEKLLRTINDLAPDLIAVDAPLTFPPCAFGCERKCAGVDGCEKASVLWMREECARRRWSKAKFPAPYTHRPVDLLMRGRWQDDTPVTVPSEEAMGSGRAPITVRMNYLRQRLLCKELVEVSPRFALAGFADWYGMSVRELRRARDIEHGAENRFTILNKMAERTHHEQIPQLNLFMTEVVALAKDLDAFDAFLCALTGVYSELNLLEPLEELRPEWGWVARPRKRASFQEARGEA